MVSYAYIDQFNDFSSIILLEKQMLGYGREGSGNRDTLYLCHCILCHEQFANMFNKSL